MEEMSAMIKFLSILLRLKYLNFCGYLVSAKSSAKSQKNKSDEKINSFIIA